MGCDCRGLLVWDADAPGCLPAASPAWRGSPVPPAGFGAGAPGSRAVGMGNASGAQMLRGLPGWERILELFSQVCKKCTTTFLWQMLR